MFDPENGTPLALMDGTYITATRTAAGSALATRLLAREDAEVLAILGTGVQAHSHARALPRVRDFTEIRVAGRDRERAEALASELGRTLAPSIRTRRRSAAPTSSPRRRTRSSRSCVASGLRPGAHVNSVGLNPPGREVDEQTVADALIVVESRESAFAPPPAGAPELAGIVPDQVHAELGELVAGTKPGRTSPEEITLYKSVGVAVQDVAAAALVLAAAQGRSIGRAIELEELT